MSRCIAGGSANPHLELLGRIVRETRVLSPARYEHVEMGRRRVPAAGSEESSRALVRALTDLIYGRYYLDDPRAIDGLSGDAAEPPLLMLREDADLGRALRRANTSSGYLDAGWTVVELPPATEGTYIVRKGRLSLSARPDQVAPATSGGTGGGAPVRRGLGNRSGCVSTGVPGRSPVRRGWGNRTARARTGVPGRSPVRRGLGDRTGPPIPIDAIALGATVAVRFPKDRPYAMAGFYAAVGSAGPPSRAEPLVRWYFHLLPEGAPVLFAELTRGLGELQVPFGLKALNDPDAYTRPDAAVLYLPRTEFDRTFPVVIEAHQAVGAAVRPRVPAFTRAVRPGLGLAEEPPQGAERTSFGQHRSRLIARGLVEAALQRRNSAAGRLDAVLATFAAEGISLDAPHLNPGSAEFEIPARWIGGLPW